MSQQHTAPHVSCLQEGTVSTPIVVPAKEEASESVFPKALLPGDVLWMDEIHSAPPKKPWNDDSPVNTNRQWFPMVSNWCRISSTHSMWQCILARGTRSKAIGGP